MENQAVVELDALGAISVILRPNGLLTYIPLISDIVAHGSEPPSCS